MTKLSAPVLVACLECDLLHRQVKLPPGGEAWRARDRNGQRQHEAHSVLVEWVNSPEVSALVTAHAIALDALSREIAEALNSLAKAR